eukprot:921848_1
MTSIGGTQRPSNPKDRNRHGSAEIAHRMDPMTSTVGGSALAQLNRDEPGYNRPSTTTYTNMDAETNAPNAMEELESKHDDIMIFDDVDYETIQSAHHYQFPCHADGLRRWRPSMRHLKQREASAHAPSQQRHLNQREASAHAPSQQRHLNQREASAHAPYPLKEGGRGGFWEY